MYRPGQPDKTLALVASVCYPYPTKDWLETWLPTGVNADAVLRCCNHRREQPKNLLKLVFHAEGADGFLCTSPPKKAVDGERASKRGRFALTATEKEARAEWVRMNELHAVVCTRVAVQGRDRWRSSRWVCAGWHGANVIQRYPTGVQGCRRPRVGDFIGS